MTISDLRREVYEANMELFRANLVAGTAGNVSGLDRKRNLVAIKPSGVPYVKLRPSHMVVADLSGAVVEGRLKPSVDLVHHLYIYNHMDGIGGVTHTHSPAATAFAALGMDLAVYSTGHADIFGGPVPCAPYADNKADRIGKAIVRCARRGCPAVLLARHGAFTFEPTPEKAVKAAAMLEASAAVARDAMLLARVLGKKLAPMPAREVAIWYARHHGGGYGQE